MAKQKTKTKAKTKKTNKLYKAEHELKIERFTQALHSVLSDLVVEATFMDFDITDPYEFTDHITKEIVYNAAIHLAPELLESNVEEL